MNKNISWTFQLENLPPMILKEIWKYDFKFDLAQMCHTGPFHLKIEEEDKLLHLAEYLLRDRPSEQT